MAPGTTPPARVWDEVAASYAATHARSRVQARLSRLLLTRVCARVPRGAHVVDVGAGPGTHTIPLAAAGYRVTAVDVSARMLEVLDEAARRAGVSVTLRQVGPGEGWGEGHDAAISAHGPFSYAADVRPLVSALARAVVPGGPIWLALPRAAALEQVLRAPGRALAPLLWPERSHPLVGKLGGQELVVYLRDPSAWTAALSPWFGEVEVRGSGLLLHGPAALDRQLGRWPLLRRLGASSLIEARRLATPTRGP